jgi:two-component system, response regulator YesN
MGYISSCTSLSVFISHDNYPNTGGYDDVDYNIITNFFVTHKKAECQEYLKSTFEQMKLNAGFTPTIFKSNMLKMLFHIISILKKLVANPEDIPDEIRYFDINFETSATISEIAANTLAVVTKAFEYLEHKEDTTNYTIKQILEYVNQNIELNLSLKTLSYKFAVNASYLGQLFKKETGVMFSSYLNNIRIERAKELLANSQMKVSEVSEKVGFLDPSHFYKLFRNSTGLSPAEYKEKTVKR